MPHDRPPSRSASIAVFLATAALVLLGLQLVAWWLEFTPVDDAYISLRYARNWAEGVGLVYNPGEIVEGYTSFLMVALETGAIRLGLDPVLAMSLLSIASTAALAGLTALFIRRHVYPGRNLLALLGGALIGLNPALLAWGSSGMEACLFALFVLAALMAALCEAPTLRLIGPALVVTLAAMTRPEGVVLFPVFVVLTYLRDRSVRRALLQSAWIAIPFGLYFVIRWVHFGSLFPNTFYAKLDYGGARIAWRGLRYVVDFVLASPLVVAACVIALPLLRSAPAWPRALVAAAGMLMLATIYEGGDHFALFRFLVPVLPLLGLLALYPSALLCSQRGAGSGVGRAVIAATLAALGVTDLTLGAAPTRLDASPQSHLKRFEIESRVARQWVAVGRWLGANAPADGSVATIAIGAIGFESRLRMIDPVGLIDPAIAHRSVELGLGYAGHEKMDVDRVLSERPTYLLAIHFVMPFPVPREEVGSYAWGTFNQAVLQDPRVAREYAYLVEPIANRYLNYFVRVDATAPAR